MGADKRLWVFGPHAVRAVLERAPERVLELFIAARREDARSQALRASAAQLGLTVQPASDAMLTERTGSSAHQGIAASIRPARPWDEADLERALGATTLPLLLVLDGVTDPHNLGACVRTAAAAGALALIVPRDRSASLEGAARKAAAGMAEFLPIVTVTNLARTLGFLKARGVWIAGTDASASATLYEADLARPLALVLGSEGEGMRRLTRERCDFLMRIPMAEAAESLNVSVAAGIALFEAQRQRRQAEAGAGAGAGVAPVRH